MKIKGAVLREAGKPYTIEELELEPPKEKEALVRYVYTGYCHSDLHVQLGEIPIMLPLVAGHECAGIVEEVGPGRTMVKKGDHVVGTGWRHAVNARNAAGVWAISAAAHSSTFWKA